MKERELVSIVVPVYKAEQYLPACVDSVLAQTYQNLEVILVDDGSPDGSGAICEEYAARDPRVRVIHRENGGLCAARNTGLDAARGAYIGFVDSDDYIEPDMCRLLYERLQAAGAEVAQCGLALHHEDGSIENVYGIGEDGAVYSGAQCLGETLAGAPWASMCGKLYRAELFQSVRCCEELRLGEDFLFAIQLFSLVRCMVFVKRPLYHYIWHPVSLSKFGLHYKDNIKAALLVRREVEQKHPQLSGHAYRHFTETTVSICENLLLNRSQYDRRAYGELMALARSELREALPVILKTPEVGKTLKIKTRLITLAPGLYDFLFPVWLKMTGWRKKRRVS